jgi:pyridinium-3,5-bisthiocarboxylic acid mononucleotide nickel chelatase
MRIAYLDCFSGISGDMFLGALVDSGVPPSVLEETVAALNIGARLEISRVNRSGISATKVDVYSHGEKDLPREEYWAQQAHKHELERQHRHEHHHAEHSHTHDHQAIAVEATEPPAGILHEHHSHGRGLTEIRQIISRAAISPTARQTAIRIFESLGSAEGHIHNTDIETIHFHEVGAIDAMVDIVCAAVGSEALGVDEIVCSPLNLGGGTVQCAHGTFPVPAPATLELLKQAPVYSSGVQAELVTPTGAAIVKNLATRFAAFPPMKVGKIGYGAGTRDFAAHANVLRITIGELESSAEEAANPTPPKNISLETVTVLEANLDDLNPQVFGYVMDQLLAQGALDVFGVPVQMKKNRPGMVLTVLCRPEQADALAQLIFRETTTLGVRQHEERRQVLAREWVNVSTDWGTVRIKIACMNGKVTHYAPEYEDCRQIATEHKIALKEVMQAAVQSYLQEKSSTTEATEDHGASC